MHLHYGTMQINYNSSDDNSNHTGTFGTMQIIYNSSDNNSNYNGTVQHIQAEQMQWLLQFQLQ